MGACLLAPEGIVVTTVGKGADGRLVELVTELDDPIGLPGFVVLGLTLGTVLVAVGDRDA